MSVKPSSSSSCSWGESTYLRRFNEATRLPKLLFAELPALDLLPERNLLYAAFAAVRLLVIFALATVCLAAAPVFFALATFARLAFRELLSFVLSAVVLADVLFVPGLRFVILPRVGVARLAALRDAVRLRVGRPVRLGLTGLFGLVAIYGSLNESSGFSSLFTGSIFPLWLLTVAGCGLVFDFGMGRFLSTGSLPK